MNFVTLSEGVETLKPTPVIVRYSLSEQIEEKVQEGSG